MCSMEQCYMLMGVFSDCGNLSAIIIIITTQHCNALYSYNITHAREETLFVTTSQSVGNCLQLV